MIARYLLNFGGGIHENFDAIRGDKTGLLAKTLHTIDKLASAASVDHFLAEQDMRGSMKDECKNREPEFGVKKSHCSKKRCSLYISHG